MQVSWLSISGCKIWKIYCHEKNNGLENDIHCCSLDMASALTQVILIWLNTLAIDLDDEHPSEVKARLLLVYEIKF